MKNRTLKIGAVALFLAVQALAIVGCTKEHDPHEKIDAPGYYNGPMKPRGGNAPGGAGGGGSDQGQ